MWLAASASRECNLYVASRSLPQTADEYCLPCCNMSVRLQLRRLQIGAEICSVDMSGGVTDLMLNSVFTGMRNLWS